MNAVLELDRDNGSDCVIRSVGLDDYGLSRNEVGKNGCFRKLLLQPVEGLGLDGAEMPWNVLPSESGKGLDNSRVVMNKATIEITKTQKGLNVLDLSGCGPCGDGLYFTRIHFEAID
jgi:hypothetical protein